MAIDIEALRNLGMSDEEIAQIANFSPSQLNMGILAPNVGGYGGEYRTFDAPLSNKGNPTSKMGNNQIFIAPQTQVRLVNRATGEVVVQGVGYDAAQQAIDAAKALTASGGNKANWQIQTAAPGEGAFSVAANEKRNKSVLGKIADIALPVVGGLLGGPLGAAAGSTASSAAQGRGLGATLLRAGIAGGTAALMPGGPSPSGAATQTIGQTTGQAATQAASQAATQAATQAADDIVVNAIMSSLLNQAAGGAVGGLASSIVPSFFDSAQLSNTAPTQTQSAPASAASPATAFPDEIIVKAKDAAPITFGDVSPLLLPGVGAALGSSIASTATPDLAQVTPEDKSLLDRIASNMGASEYLTAASLLGGAVAGGGGGGGARRPDTSGINFTKTTLRPTVSAVGIGGNYPYTPTTYGRSGGDQEAEYLFFTKDPLTAKESSQTGEPASMVNPASIPVKKEGGEIHEDMVKHLVEYQKGSGHRGPGKVTGIGSGQEDLIPAWLSDGEYVWSAQDVADLGDGSTDEGVRRLDKMRQMVRQQAGRKEVKKIAKPQKGIDTILKAVGGLV